MATNDTNKNGGNLGFEAELFKAADKLRGTLLPRLISGELRISDAERFLGEVEKA